MSPIPRRTSNSGGIFHAPVSDRKSTRLNSSHLGISYAVFCLKRCGDHRDLHSFPTRRSSDLCGGNRLPECRQSPAELQTAEGSSTPPCRSPPRTAGAACAAYCPRSEEHTSELQSLRHL